MPLTTNSVPVLRSLGHGAIAAADTAALMGLGSMFTPIGAGVAIAVRAGAPSTSVSSAGTRAPAPRTRTPTASC